MAVSARTTKILTRRETLRCAISTKTSSGKRRAFCGPLPSTRATSPATRFSFFDETKVQPTLLDSKQTEPRAVRTRAATE